MPAGAIRLRDYMFCHPELTTKFANTLGAWLEDDDIPWEDDDPEPRRASIFVKPSPGGIIRVTYDGGVWEIFEGAGTLRCRFTDADLKDIEIARALVSDEPTDPWREFDLAHALSDRSLVELGPGESRLLLPVREAHIATMDLLKTMLDLGEIEAWAHEGKMRGPVFQVEKDVVHALQFYTTETARLGADPTILWGVRLRAVGVGSERAEAVQTTVTSEATAPMLNFRSTGAVEKDAIEWLVGEMRTSPSKKVFSKGELIGRYLKARGVKLGKRPAQRVWDKAVERAGFAQIYSVPGRPRKS